MLYKYYFLLFLFVDPACNMKTDPPTTDNMTTVISTSTSKPGWSSLIKYSSYFCCITDSWPQNAVGHKANCQCPLNGCQQSRSPTILDKTVETLQNELELSLWKPLTAIDHPPSPPYQCCFATKKTLINTQSFQTTMSEGRGEGKHFCDLVGVSVQGNWKCRLIRFVSTSFVQDCS